MRDFLTMKGLVIPEGEVVKIEDLKGKILWEKYTEPSYTELWYLESTGKQFIDTGYSFNSNTDTIELDYACLETSPYKWIFGNYVGTYLGLSTHSYQTLWYGGGTSVNLKFADYNINRHKLIINENGVSLDDTRLYNFKSFENSVNLYLFAMNYNGTLSTGYKGKAKIWGYKHNRNGKPIRDFIPVLDANGTPCLYDKVTKQFFYNQGIDNFLYGEKPYKTELLYLEGTGKQYINTGKYAPLNTDIAVKFHMNNTEHLASNNGAVFGGREVQTSQTCTLFYLASGYPQYFRFDRTGQKFVADANKISINSASIYEFSYKNNTTSTANLTTGEIYNVSIGTPSDFTNSPIYLFSVNTQGTPGTFFKGKIYEWKYWENNVMLQHLIPVLDKDDVPCMYNKVDGMFFYNNGTDQFLYDKTDA